ncbi:DNA or RNA helicases of superfamily II [Streptococcus pneumoniae]|nr:DNA or RNA helicases of superfamily II [Streptococcus pneumoniae]
MAVFVSLDGIVVEVLDVFSSFDGMGIVSFSCVNVLKTRVSLLWNALSSRRCSNFKVVA